MSRTRLLIDHLAYIRGRLLQHAEHIGIGEHSDVRGLAREAIVQLFLKDNLPSAVDYATGEILDETDKRSGQVDIILQSAYSPKIKLFGDINIALADSVLSAIEVKSTLTTATWEKPSHLKAALDAIVRIRQLQRNRAISLRMLSGETVTLPHIPCFILAFDGPTRETLEPKLHDYGKHFNLPVSAYWPDVITVLSRGYYVALNNQWLVSIPDPHVCTGNENAHESLVGMFTYICKIIEAANTQHQATHFQAYFSPPAEGN